jgi:excisionase family DNA binding protein
MILSDKPERASYSPEELVILLGISRRKVYDSLNSGAIPSIRLGKRFIIPRVAIAEWLRTAGNCKALS